MPAGFLGTSPAAPSGTDEYAAPGFVAASANDEAEASPQESSADLPFFGTPSFSFFGGVPLDLVVTPMESGDSLIGCSPASSSS